MKTVIENIRALRLAKNLTQKELAEKLGITIGGYQKLESGENDLTLTRLEQIADVHGVSVVSLFEGTDSANKESLALLEQKIKENEDLLEQINTVRKLLDLTEKQLSIRTFEKETLVRIVRDFVKNFHVFISEEYEDQENRKKLGTLLGKLMIELGLNGRFFGFEFIISEEPHGFTIKVGDVSVQILTEQKHDTKLDSKGDPQ